MEERKYKQERISFQSSSQQPGEGGKGIWWSEQGIEWMDEAGKQASIYIVLQDVFVQTWNCSICTSDALSGTYSPRYTSR